MQIFNLLDVSLRDGGHRTNFHFSNEHLEAMLKWLDNSGLEYIEIGYRNGSLHPIVNIGEAGLCKKNYLRLCQSLIKKAKIAVMVHPGNINEDDLKELKKYGVRLLRICIPKGEVETAYKILKAAKKLGFEVSVNFIHMSYYHELEMDEVVKKISKYRPDLIYFADSNGSMLPAEINKIYSKYTKQYDCSFGFHAHDNLGLAQANTLAALKHGARYVDVSLAGMGKGIGNLKAEFFTAYLHAIKIKKYNLEPLLEAANYVRKELGIGHEDIEMDEFIRGITDLSTADLKASKMGS